MIIGLEGFGSVWSRRTRLGREVSAFYNTTGIIMDGQLRHRSRVFGQVRFNEVGGFNPMHIERNIGRVFKAAGNLEPSNRCVLLHHLLSCPIPPDYYLFVVTSDRTGQLQIDCEGWKSDGVVLVSLSQIGTQQEAMLLMPVHSWLRGSMGLYVVEPCVQHSWRALLQLRA
jgi:hypothetical protein